MRWSYKTVHFELKKDGILGGAFLDESELEQSLNEYGLSGWELISMLEVRDGVIAVFKQALALPERSSAPAADAQAEKAPIFRKNIEEERKPAQPSIFRRSDNLPPPRKYPLPAKENIQIDKSVDEDRDEDSSPPADLGSIRIE